MPIKLSVVPVFLWTTYLAISMAQLRKMCLSHVKCLYRHHQNVVMGGIRYYVIQNKGGSALEMTTICYGMDGWVFLDDYPILETCQSWTEMTFARLIFIQKLRKVAYTTSVLFNVTLIWKLMWLKWKLTTGSHFLSGIMGQFRNDNMWVLGWWLVKNILHLHPKYA